MSTPNNNEQPLNVKLFEGGSSALGAGAVMAVVGLGAFAAGWLSEDTKQRALFSYLTAYMFGLSITIGGLMFLFVNYLMRTKWSVTMRRVTETVAGLFPLFLVLFIPIFLGRKDLYNWMTPEEIVDPIVEHAIGKKKAYLNEPFFLARVVLYFVIWIGFATLLRSMSKKNDSDASYDQHPTAYKLSAIGLAFTSFALTFASFDWMMSLAPEWFSTMYGVWFFAGGFMAFFASMILLVSGLESNGHFKGILSESGDHFHALGRMMFAFLVFWAYVSYAQGFITYIANKPEETTWFISRTSGSWREWGWLLVFGHFLMPFIILLLRWLKFVKRPLAAAAVWLLLMHYADIYYQVMPTIHKDNYDLHWLDVASLLGVVGAMLAFGVWLLRGRLIAPKNDVYLEKGRRYHSP